MKWQCYPVLHCHIHFFFLPSPPPINTRRAACLRQTNNRNINLLDDASLNKWKRPAHERKQPPLLGFTSGFLNCFCFGTIIDASSSQITFIHVHYPPYYWPHVTTYHWHIVHRGTAQKPEKHWLLLPVSEKLSSMGYLKKSEILVSTWNSTARDLGKLKHAYCPRKDRE